MRSAGEKVAGEARLPALRESLRWIDTRGVGCTGLGLLRKQRPKQRQGRHSAKRLPTAEERSREGCGRRAVCERVALPAEEGRGVAVMLDEERVELGEHL